MTSGEAAPDDGAREWDLYKILVEEYRFQVTLNWQRTQYLLALNLGLVGAGTGLLGIMSPMARALTSALLLVGGFVALASIRVVSIQQGYYRETRSRKTAAENRLGITATAPRPTRGMREQPRTPRFGPASWNVNDLIRILLGLLALVDFTAAGTAFGTVEELRESHRRIESVSATL